ncbi:MAG: carbon-nitrogen hydrolase family protein [Pseudomonadota bacterium]
MPKFSVALIQAELENADNTALLRREIKSVRARFPWVDMVVLAELASLGTSPKAAQTLPGPTENMYADLAREVELWIIPGSLYELSEGVIYNTAPVINPAGEVVARARKTYPFAPYEQGVAGGEHFTTFDVPGAGRFGVSICYDMWFPETTRSLVHLGAEAIIHPSLTGTIDRDVELSIARASAAMNNVYFFDVNAAGNLGLGQTIAVGPGGEVLHQAGAGREIIPLEIDFDYVRRVRERGWNGLGQPLKSFRDQSVTFPAYSGEPSPSLNALGPLKKPGAE